VPVQTREMALEEAKQADALMLFGEKYDEVVRVVSMSVEHAAETSEAELRRSAELCGGTHVDTSAQVFPFKVTSEGSVAAGTRRVEAVAGAAALRWLEDQREALSDVADVVRVNAALRGDARNVVQQAARLADKERAARQQAAALRLRLLEAQAAGPPAAARGRVAVHRVPDLCPDDAKETAEALKLFAARAVQERPALLHLLLCGETRIASAAGKDSGLDAGKALRLCLDEMGRRGVTGGKGGGGKEFAQGQLKHGDDALCVLDATTAVLGA
jgi:alanyl-tRNA synthetase